SSDQYKIVRSKDKQVEYNLKSGDSTVYGIKWDKDCQYSLTRISSSEKKLQAQEDVLNKPRLAYEILSVTRNYYVYNSYLDKVLPGNIEHRQMSTDTAWLKPPKTPTNHEIFKVANENPGVLKRNFKDTSQYAVIYMYRPHRSPASQDDYYVYFGEDFMFWALNKSKAAFKILKEGPARIHAKSGEVESTVIIDIQFGKKYYLDCRIYPKAPYAAPEIRIEEQTDGEIGFDTLWGGERSQETQKSTKPAKLPGKADIR
ncbi:MAG TPA: hypothetical protein VFN95_15585, partial [Flavitalea sp.]|nr:hypothetical protein [Flavitalea sp.]